MIVNVHDTPNGKMIAICDSDILGKTFEEGELQLDLSSRFYQGEEKTAEEAESVLKDSYVVNAVGKESVGLLVKKNLVKKENIGIVSGIPYAQCVVER
ncbi:DUF424 family protein [Candidatus Woesearchaeota archaeon]|nr:DUF424 family protein [Candidatus Woesearchaeota archaeon]